ncbi:MAG TPA: glycosyltransferase family 1 protein [Chloroflexota bacterium]|nr:glycosyltransferase family 1 protein [Chloroflexota bacterium]
MPSAPPSASGSRPSVLVDARLLHYNQAGIGRYLRHLYTAMAALPCQGVAGGATPEPEAIGVLYHRKDTRRALSSAFRRSAVAWTPAHHPLERWTLALEVARLRPRLLHAPDHVCPQPLGWHTVVTVHDLAFWRYPETHAPASRAYYAGLRRSLRQATRVICVSEATRRDLLALTGVSEAKVRVVHEAPDPAYQAAALEPYGEPGPAPATEQPFFVFVGTIEPRKNLESAFRALASLPAGERPRLLVVGAPGWGAGPIQALPATLGIEKEVRFLGRLPTPQVATLYRRALALVYPSLLEGFGLPVLEAMASGAPVIAADRSSIPEVAGDAAVLVEPTDVEALAQAMHRVATDAAHRQALRIRGLARAREFSWERAARETWAVFHEALTA